MIFHRRLAVSVAECRCRLMLHASTTILSIRTIRVLLVISCIVFCPFFTACTYTATVVTLFRHLANVSLREGPILSALIFELYVLMLFRSLIRANAQRLVGWLVQVY